LSTLAKTTALTQLRGPWLRLRRDFGNRNLETNLQTTFHGFLTAQGVRYFPLILTEVPSSRLASTVDETYPVT